MKKLAKYPVSLITFFALLLPVSGVVAQGNISVNGSIYLDNSSDKDKVIVYNLWKDYLNARPDSIYDLPQWNDADKIKYECPDLLETEGYLSPGLYDFFLMGYSYKVLELRKEEPRKYIIRGLLYAPLLDNDIYVLAITNHVAKKDISGQYKLYNWIDEYSKDWTHKTVGCINYIYYPEFNFNEQDAQSANDLISFFKSEFNISLPEHITYYIARNCDDIYRLKGFDFVVGMGDHVCNTCGFTDRTNSIIYADAIKGANYQHELCRLINPYFPHAHTFMIQGIAEFFNSTCEMRGFTHKEHYANMLSYIDSHPDTDIKDINSTFYTMDDKTAPSYLVGKIICDELYNRGGYKLLKEGMEKDAEDFFQFLKKAIGVSTSKFNSWMYGKIKENATK